MGFSLIYTPVLHFDDINGRPLVGGKLYTYNAGTSTPVATYRDKDGHEANTNPILLNERGECVCFLDDGLNYKFVLKDALDNTIWEQDNVSIPAGGGGGGSSIQAVLPLNVVNGALTNNGTNLTCTGDNAWAEGDHNEASGEHSHAEGSLTIASGANSHAEGCKTKASGEHSHAEGFMTESGSYCHSEGAGTKASNTASHAEGRDTKASGEASHAEGRDSEASGDFSHAGGYGTKATGESSTAVGKFNNDWNALFSVGNGTNAQNRSDAFKVDRSGDTWVMKGGSLVKLTEAISDVLDDHDPGDEEIISSDSAYYYSHELGKFYEIDGLIYECTGRTREGEPGSYTYTTTLTKINGVVPALNILVDRIAALES